jgi:hypothetical protein
MRSGGSFDRWPRCSLDASEWSSKELGSLWLAVLAGSR